MCKDKDMIDIELEITFSSLMNRKLANSVKTTISTLGIG